MPTDLRQGLGFLLGFWLALQLLLPIVDGSSGSHPQPAMSVQSAR